MLTEYILQFKHLFCPLHPEQRLSLACFEADCDKNGLVCAQCQFTAHKDHNVRPLNMIIFEINKDITKNDKLVQKMAKIDQERLKIQRIVNKLSNQKQKTMLKHYVEICLKDVQSKIVNYRQNCQQILAQKDCTVQDLNKFLKKYQLYKKQSETEKDFSNFQFFLKQIQLFSGGKTLQLEEAIKKRGDISQLLSIFTPFESESQSFCYIFSDSMKHSSITVAADRNSVTQLNNYSTNYALIEPMLQGKRTLRNKRTLKIKIDKLSSWLSVGVVYQGIAKKASYYFNTGNLGHGGYLISNNGYSWHNSDSALNSFYEQWTFIQGDTVCITIDPKKMKIIFQKQNGTGDPYQLPYQQNLSQQLYFCVALSSHDESASIVK